MRLAELDAVTIDANGTLIELEDPLPALEHALRSRGVARSPRAIRSAFAEEGAYYMRHSLAGRDEVSLGVLQRECVSVFLSALHADLDTGEFVPDYVGSLVFEPVPGAPEAVAGLAARGLALAVVANWDYTLPDHLERHGLLRPFTAVVTSAEAGAEKPDPAIFRAALERLGVPPGRALHVGDQPADETGARRAGMGFAPAPLVAAYGGLR